MPELRRTVVSGLVVVAPLAITVIAILYLLRFIAGLPLVGRIEPSYLRPPLVIAVFLALVMVTGYLMRTTVGTVFFDLVRSIINRIPLLRVVYNATDLAVETAVRDRERRVQPVRLQAWKGLRVTAFDTGNRTQDGRRLCFFPTAPNITTGYVIEVEDHQITPTGEPIEHALTRLLSAGFGDGGNDKSPLPESQVVEYVHNVELPGRR